MPQLPARDRLVAAADELFYSCGIGATGVDTIARVAQVTKPTLYAHFRSKNELVVAVLRQRHAKRMSELTEWLAPVDRRREPLAVFDWLDDFYAHAGHRGCGFLNAAAELTDDGDSARLVVQEEKAWLLDVLVGLCRAAGHGDPDWAGSALLLLVDGVAGRVVVNGPQVAPAVVADGRAAAEAILRHRMVGA